MKEVYLIRHGEKDAAGFLTERGKQAADAMRAVLPAFAHVFSSSSDRASRTAQLLTGEEPRIDDRAMYAGSSAEVVGRVSTVARDRNLSFLDAARLDGHAELLRSIDDQAHALNQMIDELLAKLAEDERALIVSHDLTIVPAMEFRGMPGESIDPLTGFVISADDGASSVRRY